MPKDNKTGKPDFKITRPGALTEAVGKGKDGKINQKKAKAAEKAPGKLGQEARFFENVLKPADNKRKGK